MVVVVVLLLLLTLTVTVVHAKPSISSLNPRTTCSWSSHHKLKDLRT